MIKNKKGLLIIIIILVVIYFLISIFINLFNGKKYSNTVFIGDYTKVQIKNNKIRVYNQNSNLKGQDVKVYFKNNVIEGYINSSDNGVNNGLKEYNVFNEKGESLIFENVLIAFTKDLSPSFKKVVTSHSDDKDLVKKILKNSNIIYSDNFVLNYFNISNFDIEGDDKDETIYSIGIIDDETEYKSYAIYNKDEKYYIIDREESNYNGIEYTRLIFSNLIDFNNDDNYEFVVEKVISEYGPDYYYLYNFEDSEFAMLELEG